MKKSFTLLQLFSLTDGRLSTTMDDIYDMLNHICDTELFTHHLPVALDYLEIKNPVWFQDAKTKNSEMGINEKTPFDVVIAKFKAFNPAIEVPQLKDEFDTSDFNDFMNRNSLLNKIGSKV
jgi:hypothetical protein